MSVTINPTEAAFLVRAIDEVTSEMQSTWGDEGPQWNDYDSDEQQDYVFLLNLRVLRARLVKEATTVAGTSADIPGAPGAG